MHLIAGGVREHVVAARARVVALGPADVRAEREQRPLERSVVLARREHRSAARACAAVGRVGAEALDRDARRRLVRDDVVERRRRERLRGRAGRRADSQRGVPSRSPPQTALPRSRGSPPGARL